MSRNVDQLLFLGSKNGKIISLNREVLKTSQKESKRLKTKDILPIPTENHNSQVKTTITVENTDTVSATIHVTERGAKNPVLINLANASYPGGGFIPNVIKLKNNILNG